MGTSDVCETDRLLWFCCWMIAFSNDERGLEERSDWMRPPAWSGSFWGPAASRARSAGELLPLPMDPEMARWHRWGRDVLREGDIVFRLGDARAMRGIFALSWFIARATGSPFSHTGIVAIEDGSPMVYDCSSDGIRLMPFEVWMLDCVGSMGVKRLKPEHRRHIPGVMAYCRSIFEQQVPFDFEFRLDDSALYCLEMTEKAFRSQGLALSEPVRIGDWEHLTNYPITAVLMPVRHAAGAGAPDHPRAARLRARERSPGGVGLAIAGDGLRPGAEGGPWSGPGQPGGISLRGDFELIVFAAGELRRSYSELPVRWMSDLTLRTRVQELLSTREPDARQPGPKGS